MRDFIDLPFLHVNNQDVVAIFDQNFNQVFSNARILKVLPKPSAKGMQQPLESGGVTTDHVIILPTEIEVTAMIRQPDIQDTYSLIKQYFLNSTLLYVQTKADIFPDMYISEMPHQEDGDRFDSVSIVISFTHALIVKSKTTTIPAPKNPAYSATVNRGTQQPVAPKKTTLQDIAAAVLKRF